MTAYTAKRQKQTYLYYLTHSATALKLTLASF